MTDVAFDSQEAVTLPGVAALLLERSVSRATIHQ